MSNPSVRLIRPQLEDRGQVYRWMTAPGVVERMMGPPDFSDSLVPSFEQFCDDWVAHYWTHERPHRGRLFLIVTDGERVGTIAHNEVVATPGGERATEIDMWLRGPDVLGQGFGPAALELVCARVRRELSVERAFLQPSGRNFGAINAYRKAGFERWDAPTQEAAAHFSTEPDYGDSVFLTRDLRAFDASAPRFVRLPDDFDRRSLVPLFRLADDSEHAIATYIDRGVLYALVKFEEVVAQALTIEGREAHVEIRSLAVREDLHGQGLGSYLMRAVLQRLTKDGARLARVATAAAGIDQLRFYQRLGFRFASVERDWFTLERGYASDLRSDGIRILDRVWLDMRLGGSKPPG